MSIKTRKKLQKVASVATSAATILWLSGVSMLLPAMAATYADGTLLKGSAPTIWAVNNNLKVEIRSADVFNNSGYDWNAIKSVSDATLNSVPNADLIKTATNPDVYKLEKNFKRKLASIEIFNSYNLDWNKISVVSQPVMDSFSYAPIYQHGVNLYWRNDDGSNRLHLFPTMELFTGNGYQTRDLIVVNDSEFGSFAIGENISSAPAVAPITGAVSVSLAADTPVSTTIVADSNANEYPQALIPFTKVNFTTGSDAATVTTLKFTRTGVSADVDLGNLYLYDGDTKIAEYNSFSDKVVTFTNSSGLFNVPANSTKAITLKGDLARGSTSVGAGKTIGFAVNAASDVVTGGTISGTFPISGNVMTTAQVSDLGHVYFSSYTTYPSSVKGDQANVEVWRLTATADAQNMEIRYLRFTMVGTIAVTDIKNLKLEVGGVQVGSTVGEISSDKTVVFDLSSSPISVLAGQSKIIVLRGDMAGGAGRVFKFTVQRSADIVLKDTAYGVYVTPNITNTTTAFSLIEPTAGNGTSVESGTLTLGVASDSPTGNIADGGTGLTFAKFSFYAAGEAVKIDNLTVTCASNGSDDYIDNLKLLLEGSQVGTTDTTLKCDSGTDSTNFTFGNTFQVPAGTTKYLTVVGDTTDSTVEAGDTFAVSLAAPGSANAQGMTTMTSISTTAQTARTLTVAGGAVTVIENTAVGDKSSTNPSGTVNASEVLIASFIIVAGAGEAVDVTQIGLADDATTQVGDNFQNLKIKHDTTQIGSTIASCNASAGTYTFTPASAIRVEAGQQYVVDIYADIKSSVADSATNLNPVIVADSVTATGVNTSSDASYTTPNVNLQQAYIAANGNLTVTSDADTPLSAYLVMGNTSYSLAKFKLEADAAEDILITDITVSDSVSSAATGTLRNLKLYVDGSQVGQTVNIGSTATTTYANAVFTGLSLTIPRNTSKVLEVKADVTTYDLGASAGSTHTLALLVDKGSGVESITARGNSSGATITTGYLDYGSTPDADQTVNAMTAYRTKITVAWHTDTPSGTVGKSASQVVAKINVTNSANVGNYSATVKTMNFAISTTISNTANRTMNVYKDSTATSALATTSWLVAGLQNFGDTAITTFTDFEVAANSTKVIIVTLDTTNAASTQTLSIGMAATGDITWTDGAAASDPTTTDNLPLDYKTLSY